MGTRRNLERFLSGKVSNGHKPCLGNEQPKSTGQTSPEDLEDMVNTAVLGGSQKICWKSKLWGLTMQMAIKPFH